jgi:arginine decarboxylase-like protein
MGSFHNLFGRVNEVSLVVTDEGEVEVESLARGNGIGDVVEMVGYDVETLGASQSGTRRRLRHSPGSKLREPTARPSRIHMRDWAPLVVPPLAA